MMTATLERKQDIAALDGQRVLARGVYRARQMPIKGGAHLARPIDRASLELADGTQVWLEALDTPGSLRPTEELRRYADRQVEVTGTLHAVMPARGQGLLAPCLADVDSVELEP